LATEKFVSHHQLNPGRPGQAGSKLDSSRPSQELQKFTHITSVTMKNAMGPPCAEIQLAHHLQKQLQFKLFAYWSVEADHTSQRLGPTSVRVKSCDVSEQKRPWGSTKSYVKSGGAASWHRLPVPEQLIASQASRLRENA
jgi:hypothetical protein